MSIRRGPWTITSSKQIYKSPWMEVVEDQVIRPDGKPGIYTVAHIVPGVSILPIDESGNVYLTQEFHYAHGEVGIECACGAIDKGETPLQAAQRELEEELGITATQWTELGLTNPMTSQVNSPARLFLARNLSFGNTKLEGTETIECVKVTLEEAVRLVMESKITHAQSALLILKAEYYLRKKG